MYAGDHRHSTSMARTNPRDGELLSLSACRRLLGHVGDSLSDAEVVRLRDQLYELAQCAVAAFAKDAGDETEATVLGSSRPTRAKRSRSAPPSSSSTRTFREGWLPAQPWLHA